MKLLFIYSFVLSLLFGAPTPPIENYVTIRLFTYTKGVSIIATAMPEFKQDGIYGKYHRRFDYLLVNNARINQPNNSKLRQEIWQLYPDTAAIEKQYHEELGSDSFFMKYFNTTFSFLENPEAVPKKSYSLDQILSVGSKFFYCDKVNPDTSIQAHICIGLNGVKEAQWGEDLTYLEAFCYEAIFDDLDRDSSALCDEFVMEKRKSTLKNKAKNVSLDNYLEMVKHELFETMQQSTELKQTLMSYYEANKDNLAFSID